MPRVLITGAAGFIGMHTAIRFLNEGWDVVGLDNINNYYSVGLKRDRLNEINVTASKLGRCFDMFEEDLNSEVWIRFESHAFDAVVHLAAQAGVRYSIENPKAYLESNILGFQNVIEFVEKQSIGCFIYASSSSVYGKSSNQPFTELESCNQPESYYAATKKTNELMAHSYFQTKGINSIGLRFFTVYGPWGRPDMAPYLFVDASFKGKKIKVFNHGNQKRDFTFIDDIVEGLFLSVLSFEKVSGAQVYNLGHGAPTELMGFISEIEKATDKELDKDFVPAQLGDVEVTFADTNKLKQFINYSPKTPLKQGVIRFVEWYRKYYGV